MHLHSFNEWEEIRQIERQEQLLRDNEDKVSPILDVSLIYEIREDFNNDTYRFPFYSLLLFIVLVDSEGIFSWDNHNTAHDL